MSSPAKQLGSILARRKSSLTDAIASPDDTEAEAGSFRPPSPTDAFFGDNRAGSDHAVHAMTTKPEGHEKTGATSGQRQLLHQSSSHKPDRKTATATRIASADDRGQRFNLHLRGELLKDVLAVSVDMRRIPTKAIVALLSEAIAARKRR